MKSILNNKLILNYLATTILILVSILSSFSQPTGYIFDLGSRKPIPYANIWVDSLNIGTTSDLKGAFSFPENHIGKTLLVSAIGYYSERFVIGSANIDIYLKPRAYVIPEVGVQNYKGQTKQIITSFKKFKVDNFYCPMVPAIYARRINLDDAQRLTPFIESIKICTYSMIDCKINLRIFTVADNGEPGEDLLGQNLIIKIKPGLRLITKISLADVEKIRIPTEGLFIAFEYLIVPENEYIYKYYIEGPEKEKIRNYPGNDKSKAKYRAYMPWLGGIESESEDTSWTFRGGKWHQYFMSEVGSTFTSKFRTIAMEVIVSN